MAGGLALMAVSPSFWLALVALLVAGSGYLLTITGWTTGIQEAVPDVLRGRVMAIWTLCFLGSRPVAAVLDGALADALSPRWAAELMLVPAGAVGLLLLVRVRRDRRVATRLP